MNWRMQNFMIRARILSNYYDHPHRRKFHKDYWPPKGVGRSHSAREVVLLTLIHV
jgi:hypothetical protein